MAVYKRGNTWWYKFNWRGEKLYESARTHNKQLARQIEAARKTALAKGEVGIRDKEPPPTLREFAARFLSHVEANKSEKPNTVRFYKNSIQNLLAFEPLANARLDEIDAKLTDAFIETRRRAKLETSTINRDLAGLRRLLRFAASPEVRVIAAAPKVTLLNGENRRERVLTGPEEDVYLNVAAPLLRDFAILSFDCALRPEEVHRLEWTQFRDGAIGIHTGKTPAARRTIPASPRVCEVFERRRAVVDGPWVFPAPTMTGHISEDSLKKQHAAAVKASGVDAFPPYTLRHTALTRWAQSGMDVWTLKRLAGHEDLKTTLRYIHMNSTDDRTAMEKVWKAQGDKGAQGGDKSGDRRKPRKG
jgi:integrase